MQLGLKASQERFESLKTTIKLYLFPLLALQSNFIANELVMSAFSPRASARIKLRWEGEGMGVLGMAGINKRFHCIL